LLIFAGHRSKETDSRLEKQLLQQREAKAEEASGLETGWLFEKKDESKG